MLPNHHHLKQVTTVALAGLGVGGGLAISHRRPRPTHNTTALPN